MVANVIFIAGIHGVGKTTICDEVKKRLGIDYYACSNLIEQMDNEILDYDSKKVENIDQTQNILYESIKQNVKEEKILLDGHFCLLNGVGEISRIPLEIYTKLPITNIILITREPWDIVYSNYDKENYALDFIEKFQEEEVSYGIEVAKLLNVTLIKHDANKPIEHLIKLIKEIMN